MVNISKTGLESIVKKLTVILSLCLTTSCTDIGYTLGEETNFLGSMFTAFYIGDKNPEALPDGFSPFGNDAPEEEF